MSWGKKYHSEQTRCQTWIGGLGRTECVLEKPGKTVSGGTDVWAHARQARFHYQIAMVSLVKPVGDRQSGVNGLLEPQREEPCRQTCEWHDNGCIKNNLGPFVEILRPMLQGRDSGEDEWEQS